MKSSSFTLVQVSDLHLDVRNNDEQHRLDIVRNRIADAKPDLIVASGDVSADGHHNPGMFAKVKKALDTFPAPTYVIPGNHDIGNKATAAQDPVTQAHLDNWLATFETDRFVIDRGRWLIVGLDSQIIGSGFEAEKAQLAWFDSVLADADKNDKLVAVFIHMPPYLLHPQERLAGRAGYWVFDLEPRIEFLKRIDRPNVKLIANGHLHWHQSFTRNGAAWVWCPSTSFIVDDAVFPRGGCVSGIIRYTFTDDGVEHELVRMDDIDVEMVWMDRPRVEMPGKGVVTVAELVVDLSDKIDGTAALLGELSQRLDKLGRSIRVTILLDPNDHDASRAVDSLPLDAVILPSSEAKADLIHALGAERVVAITSTSGDPAMLSAAAIGIAVTNGSEAPAAANLSADVVVASFGEALDLVTDPTRLGATLKA